MPESGREVETALCSHGLLGKECMRDKVGILVGMLKSGGEGTPWSLLIAYRTIGKEKEMQTVWSVHSVRGMHA